MKKSIIYTIILVFFGFSSHASFINYTATVTHNSCNNDGIVHIEIQSSDIQPPYLVTWTIGQNYGYVNYNPVNTTFNSNSFDITGLPPGFINIYIDQMGNDFNFNHQSVFIPLPFTFDVNSTPGSCPPLVPATVEVLNLTGGVAPFTYELYSVALPTQLPVFPSDTITSLTGDFDSISFNGVMDLAVTDANGCRVSLFNMRDSLLIDGPSFTTNITTSIQDCHTGSISLSPSGTAPYQIIWNNLPNETSLSLNNVPTGTTYTFLITDANGCLSSGGVLLNANVWANANIGNITPAICPNSNGSVTLSSLNTSSNLTAPYTVHWNNGQTGLTLQNVSGGTYSYWIEDANGCITSPVTVSVTSTNSFSVNGYSTATGCLVDTGSAWVQAIGGVAPYAYNWNQLGSNDTITGLANGTYSVFVSDATGCSQIVSVNVPSASYFSPSLSTNNTICSQNTGSITVTINNPSPNAAPFSFLWNNGETTQSINNLDEGNYSVTITDSQGCSKTLSTTIQGIFNINTSPSIDYPSCWLLADGSIFLQNITDTTGLTIHWSNGDSGLLADSLPPGLHTVQIFNSNGCSVSRTFNVIAFSYDCACQLFGTSYVDENGNCQFDANERPVQNALIRVNNGQQSWFTYTGFDGRYQFYLLPGNYTLTETAPLYYHSSTCQPNIDTITITGSGSGCIQTVNFPNTMESVVDLNTWVINNGCAWLNHTMQQNVIVKNVGTIPVNGAQNHVAHQNTVQYSPLGIWWNYNPSTLTASINGFNIQPNQSFSNPLQYNIGANLALNQEVNFFDTVYTQSGSFANDVTPYNNTFLSGALTCNSYDPNYIEVQNMNSSQLTGEIYPDSTSSIQLRYIIHFQNTGNYLAETVVLKQKVDENFVLESLRPEAGSHPFYARIDSSNNLIITYPHINLPDSFSDPEGSQGWFSYSIIGEDPCSKNYQHTAYIYFDANEAIVTNTAETNIYCSSIDERPNPSEIKVFPNPSLNQIQLVSKINKKELEYFWIRDLVGKVVLGPIAIDFKNEFISKPIDISNLSQGMYFISSKSNHSEGIKFIKE